MFFPAANPSLINVEETVTNGACNNTISLAKGAYLTCSALLSTP